MRITHLPSSYLPESLGGTEVFVHQLSTALAAAGHATSVVIHGPGVGEARESFELGYPVFRLPEHLPERRADIYFHSAGRSPPGFARFLTEWKPDVVHFHALTLGAGCDHAQEARRAGIPYVITYHTPTFSCRRGTMTRWGSEPCDGRIDPVPCSACTLQGQGWLRPLAWGAALSPLPWSLLPDGPWIPRLALPSLLGEALELWREFMFGASHLIACANWCRDVLTSNGVPTGRVTVLRQAIAGEDRTRRLRLPLRVATTENPLRMGFFGRFCRVKGPDLLLEAVRILRAAGLPATAELVGPIDDVERAWAKGLLAEYAESSSYFGVCRGEALTDWLDTLDLAVVPSRWLETGPLTLLEAWDRGVPVIGTDLGGIRDFLRAAGMDPLLFAPEDPEALAAAVLRAAGWSGGEWPAVPVPGMSGLAERMAILYRNAVDGASVRGDC